MEAGLQLDISKREFEATTVKHFGYILEFGEGDARVEAVSYSERDLVLPLCVAMLI